MTRVDGEFIGPRISVAGLKSVAELMRRAVADRGRPLIIRSSDLLRVYGREGNNDLTRIGRSAFARRALHAELGGKAWGAAPEYRRGTWYL